MELEKCKICGAEALVVFADLDVNINEDGSCYARCCYCGQKSTTMGEIATNTNLIESGAIAVMKLFAETSEEQPVREEYVCRCYQCMALLIDENPTDNAKKVELEEGEKYLRMIRQADKNDNGEILQWFWACPNCLSDEFLIDNTND